MDTNQNKTILYHLIAVLVVIIWGWTFINSKKLLLSGMRAEEIFTVRFVIAYICIWFISPRRIWCNNMKDELWMLLLGITGGSLYFLTENLAVGLTYTTNVSFIVCTAPLITTLLAIAFVKKVKATHMLIVGSLIAVLGTAMVIFNGRFILKLNQLGDWLALGAAICWALYSLLMKKVTHRYSAVFITRKVFFYGLVTILPVFVFHPWHFPLQGFSSSTVWGNLLFLGFIASFVCFVVWSWIIKKIGVIAASNYVYLNPISTLVASSLFLDERLTWLSLAGSALILIGVFIANKHKAAI